MSDIVVIGSINIDSVIKVERLPEQDEVVMGKEHSYLGGRGANQAVAAARMGAKVALIASVGSDDKAALALNSLNSDNINVKNIYHEHAVPTGIAQITIDRNGNRVIAISQEANHYLTKEKIKNCENIIAKAKIILIQCEIPRETIEEVIYLAKKYNVKIMLNNAPVMHFSKIILNMIDYIVVNEIGLNRMAHKSVHHLESIEATAYNLADSIFILPQSHRQVLVVSKADTKVFQAPHVKSVDKTGYTGVFCGTLAALITRGESFYKSVHFATLAMALSTTTYGVYPSIPFKIDVDAFLQKSNSETHSYKNQPISILKEKAKKIRIEVIKMLDLSRSGHPGGSLSAAEIVTALYFNKMKHDPANPEWAERDRFILSKGHACPVLYAALALCGYFDKKHLKTLRKFGSILQGHPDRKRTPGVEASTGSLGQGLSIANGIAMSGKLLNKSYRVFCLLSDGELEEGQVWEAAMTSSFRKLDNLCAIIDFNGIQLSSTISKIKSSVEPIKEKFENFGWNAIDVDGYDILNILSALELAEKEKNRPTVLIAATLKGRGVSFMERNVAYHGKVPSHQECEKAINEIKGVIDANS